MTEETVEDLLSEARALRHFAAELTPPGPAARFKWASPARSWMIFKASDLERRAEELDRI